MSIPMYGQPQPPAYDPHRALVEQLVVERDAARVEAAKYRRQVRRANIAGGIVLAVWLLSAGMQFGAFSR